jgi:hypothetical protein
MFIPNGNDIKLLITTINDLLKKGMTLEAQEKIMDLREMVQGLRETCVDLREDNLLLKKKLAEKDAVYFESGVYWTKKEDGTKDGPFCLPCHDNKGKLIRLTDNGECYSCPVDGCRFYHRYRGEESCITTRERRGSWMGF